MRKPMHFEKSGSRAYLHALAIGFGTALAAAFGLLLVFSAFIASGTVSENHMLLCTLLAVSAGVFCGSLLTTGLSKQRYLMSGALIGLSVFAVLFILGVILYYPKLSHVPAMLMASMIFSMAGASLRFIKPSRRGRKRSNHR